MTAPMRHQRKRTKGWRRPLGEGRYVYVNRPLKYHNPFKFPSGNRAAQEQAVKCFQSALLGGRLPFTAEQVRQDLRGAHLLCFCNLCPIHKDGKPLNVKCEACDPCHVDVLGNVANSPEEPS